MSSLLNPLDDYSSPLRRPANPAGEPAFRTGQGLGLTPCTTCVSKLWLVPRAGVTQASPLGGSWKAVCLLSVRTGAQAAHRHCGAHFVKLPLPQHTRRHKDISHGSPVLGVPEVEIETAYAAGACVVVAFTKKSFLSIYFLRLIGFLC